MPDRSMTMPPSQVPTPAPLCPPPRTATTSSCSRAKRSALMTSSAPAHRAMRAGRLSAIAFQTMRAASYSASSGLISRPAKFSRVAAGIRLGALSDSEGGLRRGQTRHRHSEWTARDVVQTQLVAEVDRVRVASMLAADPDLEVLPRLSTLGDGHRHQPPHAVLVDRLEGVARQDLALEVADDEVPLGVVARVAESHLREVVGAKGEELRFLGDLAGDERGAWDLDHGAELVRDLDSLLLLDVLGHRLQLLVHHLQLGHGAGQRDHDLGLSVDLLLAQVARRFHDRPHLHTRDLGEEDRQAHTPKPQHGVGLVQLLDARHDLLRLYQPLRVLAGVLEVGRLADQVLQA